ncbi:glycosyltransferase family 2 protein [Algoriphagus halophilus]|uniref:glycosyltransferase family 2 protein n=1 Tax=Algoriphagus halophilus TaxID=226505 RepID=UPI00358DFD33
MPLVSILIPNYNKALYLRETLDSVLEQTYTHWECIIVDDHSTDNSWEILEEYASKDSRFKLYKRPKDRKPGGNAARNYAFELSEGDYIQWLDSDDVISPVKIEIQINQFEIGEAESISVSNWCGFEGSIDIDLAFQARKNFSFQANRWAGFPTDGLNLLLHIFYIRTFIPPHAYLIKREIHLASNGWDEELIRNQDGEYMTRILVDVNEIGFLDDLLTFYRIPTSNHTSRDESFVSLLSLYQSFEKCTKTVLSKKNDNKTKVILSTLFEDYFLRTIFSYPELSKNPLKGWFS